MIKIFQFLLTGFGLPLVAQLVQHQTQKISDKVSIFTFVARKRKDLIKTASFGIFAIVFTGLGVVLTAFAYALQTDYRFEGSMSASLIVALSTLVVGLILAAYSWNQAKGIERELGEYLQTKHQAPSLFNTIVHTLVNAFNNPTPTHSNRDNDFYASNRDEDEEHRKTLN